MLKTEVRILRDQLHQCAVSVYESGETWAANYAVRWGENFINEEDIKYWAALARDAVYEKTGTYIEPNQIPSKVKNEAWELIGYWQDRAYWKKQDMIYSTSWMADELIYIATGDYVNVNIYPLDQMVTVTQWEYQMTEECAASGNCNEYDYVEYTQTFTSADADEAFQNHNGSLENFYEQQYYTKQVYAGWYFDNAGDDTIDLLWANYYNMIFSSDSPTYMNKKDAWVAAWDYTQSGIDVGDFIAVDEQQKADFMKMDAQAQADQIAFTYTNDDKPVLPKPNNQGQPAPKPPGKDFNDKGAPADLTIPEEAEESSDEDASDDEE